MKVQLYVPPGGYFAERWSKGSTMPPLGLLYIGAVLEKAGVDVEIVPADVLKLDWSGIRKKIAADRPDIVGVTSTTENRFQSFRLVKTAREAAPGAVTVMGGPHASMAAEDTLRHIPELDIVVRGEGEMTMLDLVRALDRNRSTAAVTHVAGISYRQDGRVVTNPPRSPITNLDGLPFPAFHLVPFDKYNFKIDVPGRGPLPAVNIMTSRGCPFNCNFCATPINWGRAVRMRTTDNVIAEIESHVEKLGARVIFFYDDTFNVSVRRVEEICRKMIERRLDVFWRAEIRLDLMTKPLLARMKEAGLFHVSFGIEAGSERVRNSVIDKRISIEDFHNVVAWCRELEIIPNVFFIFSHPTETWEEAQETIRLIERYRNEVEASVAILHIYPGTPLEATAKEIGRLPADFSWSERHLLEDRHAPHGPGGRAAVPRPADLGAGQRAPLPLVLLRRQRLDRPQAAARHRQHPLARRHQEIRRHGACLYPAEAQAAPGPKARLTAPAGLSGRRRHVDLPLHHPGLSLRPHGPEFRPRPAHQEPGRLHGRRTAARAGRSWSSPSSAPGSGRGRSSAAPNSPPRRGSRRSGWPPGPGWVSSSSIFSPARSTPSASTRSAISWRCATVPSPGSSGRSRSWCPSPPSSPTSSWPGGSSSTSPPTAGSRTRPGRSSPRLLSSCSRPWAGWSPSPIPTCRTASSSCWPACWRCRSSISRREVPPRPASRSVPGYFSAVNSQFGAHPTLKAVGYFLSTLFLLLGVQSMYQKFYSARSAKDAKKAVVWWTVGTIFVETMVVVIAVFAYSKLKGQIDLSVPKEGGKIVLMAARNLVPAPVGVLLLGAACAVVISTGMNYLLSPSTTLMRDIYQRFLNRNAAQKNLVALQKVLVVAIGVVAFFLAVRLKSVLEMSFFAYTIYGAAITPALDRRPGLEEGHPGRRPGLDHLGYRRLHPPQSPGRDAAARQSPRRRSLGDPAHLSRPARFHRVAGHRQPADEKAQARGARKILPGQALKRSGSFHDHRNRQRLAVSRP